MKKKALKVDKYFFKKFCFVSGLTEKSFPKQYVLLWKETKQEPRACAWPPARSEMTRDTQRQLGIENWRPTVHTGWGAHLQAKALWVLSTRDSSWMLFGALSFHLGRF